MPTNDSSPFLIVGLGNPGSEYHQTRHNLGFDVVDLLARRWNAPDWKKKFHSHFSDAAFKAKKVLLLKPQTFMNRSGLAVGEAVSFYKVEPSTHLLVLSDDLDLPPGQLRLRLAGSSGGHNGLKSIIEGLGLETFYRIRIGVGRPQSGSIDYLLTKVGKTDWAMYSEAIQQTAEAVEAVVEHGMKRAMDLFNRKPKPPAGDEKI